MNAIRNPFGEGNATACDQHGRPPIANVDESLAMLRLLDALVSFGASWRLPWTAQELVDRAPGAVAGLERSFIDAQFLRARAQAVNVLRAYSRPEPASETTVCGATLKDQQRRRDEGLRDVARESLARGAMAFDPGHSAAEEAAALHARLLNCALCMFAAGMLAGALLAGCAQIAKGLPQ